MHPNVKKGNHLHAQHFHAIRNASWHGPGWEVWCVNQALGGSRLRPDWILINESRKLAIIVDLTSKYQPTHYKKGLEYEDKVRKMLDNPQWEVRYLEDYWLNSTRH
jgi:hypothetical protein